MKPASLSESLSRTTGVLLEAGVIFLLIFPPLAQGAVGPSSETTVLLCSLFLGVILLLFLGSQPEGSTPSRHEIPIKPCLIIAGLIILYGALMTVPIPSALHGFLSPASMDYYRAALNTSTTSSTGMFAPLSLHPLGSVEAVTRLSSYFVFFLVCMVVLRELGDVRRLVRIFVVTVFVISFLGIVQAFESGSFLLRGGDLPVNARPFGTFVNRNHFAGWASMGVMLGLGYLFSIRYRLRSGVSGERIRSREYPPGLRVDPVSERIFFGFAVTVIMASIFLSLSRGGIVSLVMALVFFSLLLGTRRKLRRGFAYAGMLLLVILTVAWLGAGPVVDRLSTFTDVSRYAQGRININRNLAEMIGEFVWVGSGPGTFAAVYPVYRDSGGARSIAYAHNDYFQLLLEWGLAGAGLFLAGLVLLWWFFLKTWFKRRDPEILFISAGAAAGLAAIMIHSFFDFNLHIPSNALVALFLTAVALRTVSCRRDGYLHPEDSGS